MSIFSAAVAVIKEEFSRAPFWFEVHVLKWPVPNNMKKADEAKYQTEQEEPASAMEEQHEGTI